MTRGRLADVIVAELKRQAQIVDDFAVYVDADYSRSGNPNAVLVDGDVDVLMLADAIFTAMQRDQGK